MFKNDGSMSLATLPGPILGRIVYSGVATNDLVQVIRNVEANPIANATSLAQNWMVDLPGLEESLLNTHLDWRLENMLTGIGNAIVRRKTHPNHLDGARGRGQTKSIATGLN